MNENNTKRRSIRKRIRHVIMAVAVGALLLVGLVNVVGFDRIIVVNSLNMFSDQMTDNLKNETGDKALLMDRQLDEHEDTAGRFARYIHVLYSHPELFVPQNVKPASEKNAGKMVMQKTLANPSVKEADVKDEMELLANTSRLFDTVITEENSPVTNIYLGTTSGFLLTYDDKSGTRAGVDYYDYFSKDWYKLGEKSEEACFTNIYEDGFGNGMMITCVIPFYNAEDEFAGVVGMDITIEDLYNSMVGTDLKDGEEAFLVDQEGKIVSTDLSENGKDLTDDDRIDEAAAQKILEDDNGVIPTEGDLYIAYAPVQSINWKYCIRIPVETVQAPVAKMLQQFLLVIALFVVVLVITILVVVFVSRRFARTLTGPILALGEDVKEISEGNLDHQAKIYRNDEIGDLAISFNEMSGSLRQHVDELTRVTAEKERIGAELNVAAKIQLDMLPRLFPMFPDRHEFDLYASMKPAREVGGDFYDIFLIDKDHLALVIADVSGKGVPASLFMVIAKTLIKTRAKMGGSPSEILEDVNDQLCEGNDEEMFVSVWLGIIDLTTGRGVSANAGHEHPARCSAQGEYELVMYRHSMVLAAMEGVPYKDREFQLEPGDKLFVYTDGVPEATSSDQELFGNERMIQALNEEPDADMKQQLERMFLRIDEFVGEAPQFDDITMLGFVWYGPEGQVQ